MCHCDGAKVRQSERKNTKNVSFCLLKLQSFDILSLFDLFLLSFCFHFGLKINHFVTNRHKQTDCHYPFLLQGFET